MTSHSRCFKNNDWSWDSKLGARNQVKRPWLIGVLQPMGWTNANARTLIPGPNSIVRKPTWNLYPTKRLLYLYHPELNPANPPASPATSLYPPKALETHDDSICKRYIFQP